MPSGGKTFRVFVSSTFIDLKAERNALHERVFPRLRERSERHGWKFQAIDLRWGVSDEASLDHQALNICLRELKRCQEISPRPNYIVLLGDRYGWRPLPAQIEAEEFEALARVMSPCEQHDIQRWYRRDDNAVPPEYVLLSRTGEFSEGKMWTLEEEKLQTALRRAADQVFAVGDELRSKYFNSATHQEVIHGLLKESKSEEHVFAYFREIEGLPKSKEKAGNYLDYKAGGSWDREAWERLRNLKAEIKSRLPGDHVSEFHERAIQQRFKWFRRRASTYEPDEHYLDAFCASVERDLARMMDQEIARLLTISLIDRENLDHERVAVERARSFVGRQDELASIERYLSCDEGKPLVVHGVSGSGKTALMAKAFLDTRQRNSGSSKIVARFIGATPDSTNLRALLIDLSEQISPAQGGSLDQPPDEMHLLTEWFQERLRAAVVGPPVILFLDALDQLEEGDALEVIFRLLQSLPDQLKAVVSILDLSDPASIQRAAEAARNNSKLTDLRVLPLGSVDGETLLRSWLADAGRTLQGDQWQRVRDGFAASGLPLWLRLAFDQARTWRSFDTPPPLPGEIPQLIHHRLDILSLPSKHGPLFVRKALGYLAAARRGLSEDELLDVLAMDDVCWGEFLATAHHEVPPGQRRFPVIFWVRLLGDLDLYLTELRVGDTLLFSFFHRQLRDCVVKRFLESDAKPGCHDILATYFEKQAVWLASLEEQRKCLLTIPPRPRAANLRRADELPWHLIELAKRDELAPLTRERLAETFLSLDFLESKVEGGLGFDLVTNLANATSVLPYTHPLYQTFRLLGEAVRRDLHFLARNPTTLFQCLWNNCWWFDCPEAASHYDAASGGGPGRESHNHSLHGMLEDWRRLKESHFPGFIWLRSLRPPNLPLGSSNVSKFEAGSTSIMDAAFTPDGKTIISGCADGTIRMWAVSDGHQLQTLRDEEDAIHRLDISEDGRWLVTGTAKGRIAVWDLKETRLHLRFSVSGGGLGAIVFSPDSRLIATGSDDGSLILWNQSDGRMFRELAGHDSAVNCLCFSPDGSLLASGSGKQRDHLANDRPDYSIRLWTVDEGEELTCLREHSQSVTALAFTPDGKSLLSGSRDETIRVWEIPSGREVRTLGPYEGSIAQVTSLALFDEGRTLVSGHLCTNSYGYYSAQIRVYDLNMGKEIRQINEENDVSKVFTSGTADLLAAIAGGLIRIFPLGNLSNEPGRLRSATIGLELILSEDGKSLIWRNGVVGVGYFGCSGWNLETWEDLIAVAEEDYNAAALAAQNLANLRWRSTVQEAQTSFIDPIEGKAAAWFPQALHEPVSALKGTRWASKAGDYVYVLSVEGGDPNFPKFPKEPSLDQGANVF